MEQKPNMIPQEEKPTCGNCWWKRPQKDLTIACGALPPGGQPIMAQNGATGLITFRPTVNREDLPCTLWVHEDDDPFQPEGQPEMLFTQ